MANRVTTPNKEKPDIVTNTSVYTRLSDLEAQMTGAKDSTVIDAINASLAQKAQQSDLNAANDLITYNATKNPYLVIEGDSTAKGGAAGASMALWLSMLLKREITNNAVWGSWTADVKSRLKTNVLDLHPKYCVLLMGTNDIHGGETRTNSLNNYEYVLDTLITNGIEPIVLSVLPRGDFPADNANIRIFNSCLLNLCREKSIKFVDIYNPLANGDGTPIDYLLQASDHLHWSTYGGILGANEVIKVFDVPTQNNVDYPNNLFKGEYPLIEDGIFNYDPNADGLSDLWTGIDHSATTYSLQVNPNGGNFQVINKTSSTVLSSGITQTIGAFTENAMYRFQSEIEFTLTDRTDGGQNNANFRIVLDFRNSSNVSIGSAIIGEEVLYSSGMPLVTLYKDFQPPVGTTSTILTIMGNATSPFTLKVGRTYANIIR